MIIDFYPLCPPFKLGLLLKGERQFLLYSLSRNVLCLLTSAAYIPMPFRLVFIMEAYTMNPDQTAP